MSEVAVPTLPPPPPGPQFDFAKPFTYVFDDPRWLNKILIGGLFYLAGFVIIGWFFVFGYLARVVRNIVAGLDRPLPEWDDLGGYFNEGVRLIAVGFIYALPMFALVMMFAVPATLLDSVDNDAAHFFASGFTVFLACILVPLSFAMMFFAPASMMFAIVEQRFGAAFEFARIWAFVRANIGNYLLAIVVYLIARMVAGVGIALCCVGVVFTGFWSFLIMMHGFAQVIRLAPRT